MVVAYSTSPEMFTRRESVNDKLRHSFPPFSTSFEHLGYFLFSLADLADLISMSMYVHTSYTTG